jgi:hypothetical protein
MFKVNTIVLSICSAFAVVGCASLGELPDRVARSLERPESRRADMSAEQMYRLAKEYQAQGRYDLAIAAHLEALKRDHTLADAHNALGIVYSQQGRYEEAFSEFKAAIELRPGEAYLHNNLGYVLLLKGLNQEALSPLEIAVQLEPGNEKAAFNLQLAHARLGSSPPTRREKSADLMHSSERTEAPVAPEPHTTSPRFVAVAPNIYELKLPEQTLPEIAPLQPAAIQEDLLHPEPVRKARAFRLEVSNGNGTRGMARQVARLLDRNGIHANRITNHATFRQTTTQIEYRQGYLAEAVALREVFPAHINAVPGSALRNDIQVRVLLGKDVVSIARTPLQAYAAADAAHSTPATAVK